MDVGKRPQQRNDAQRNLHGGRGGFSRVLLRPPSVTTIFCKMRTRSPEGIHVVISKSFRKGPVGLGDCFTKVNSDCQLLPGRLSNVIQPVKGKFCGHRIPSVGTILISRTSYLLYTLRVR